MNEIYIFGHKKPDTDSVASAIALSYLKNAQGFNAKPFILDTLNTETEFVLKYFGIETPKILNDVKLRVEDVEYYKGYYLPEYASILKAYEYIKEKNVTAVPVVDKQKKLLGLITLKTIADEIIGGNYDKIRTSYSNIVQTLKAEEILKNDKEIEGNIIIAAYASQTFIKNIKLEPNTILIVANRHTVISCAIENKIKLLILTGGEELSNEELKLAKEKKVNVISTQFDTFHTAKIIGLSNYLNTLLNNARIERINQKEYLNTLLEVSSKHGYNNYPVINDQGICEGLIRITDIRKKHRKKVILVDHNELEQSTSGLEEAEIIEIVDHHKIGNLTTNKPINFRNMSVGSTNTIVYLMYNESRVDIPKNIAGIMFSGIISDTLNFTSPTTTETDIEVASKLAKIAKINREEYARKMFKEGTNLNGKTIEQVINLDLKVYQSDDEKIAISQVLTLSADEILSKKEEYIAEMERMKEAKGYSMLVIFITDIINKGSYMLYCENSKRRLEDAFEIDELYQGIFLDGVLSRKKQIMPKIMKIV